MNQNKLEIKYLRFSCKNFRNQPHNNNVVIALYQLVCLDFGSYKILNEFFNITSTNDGVSKSEVTERLEWLKEEQELDSTIVDAKIFASIKKILINLFENSTVTNSIYTAIFTNYLEYLVMQWKKIPGRNGKVTFEPTLKYKRRELFIGKAFSKSVCDVVFKNTREKAVAIYECKFGMKTFLTNLTQSWYSIAGQSKTAKRKRNAARQAQNKINYLKECDSLFSDSTRTDILNSEVKIVTFATRTSLQNSINLLNGIPVLAREDIEAPDFFRNISA